MARSLKNYMGKWSRNWNRRRRGKPSAEKWWEAKGGARGRREGEVQ